MIPYFPMDDLFRSFYGQGVLMDTRELIKGKSYNKTLQYIGVNA